jgi:hypothetical protein
LNANESSAHIDDYINQFRCFWDSVKIDHVSIAWSNLEFLQSAFEDIGLKTDYGGVHSNGVTHMSILGFKDGSYVELISVQKPGEPSPSWGKQVANNGGPCAWAIEEDNLAEETERIRKLGIKTIGPVDYFRRRPDGVLVEWQLTFIGDDEPGATLPFLIKDKTPRDYRVKPSSSVSTSNLSGVSKVILGVRDLESTVRLFQKTYGWEEPLRAEATEGIFQGAKLADFQDSPAVIASPDASSNKWLSQRLEQFGDSPCSFLIGTESFSKTCSQYALTNPSSWPGSAVGVAWFPPSKLGDIRLGVIGS